MAYPRPLAWRTKRKNFVYVEIIGRKLSTMSLEIMTRVTRQRLRPHILKKVFYVFDKRADADN